MRRLFNRVCRVFTRKPKPNPDPVNEPVEVPPGWLDHNPHVRTACRLYYRRQFAKSEAVRDEITRRINFHTQLVFGDDAKRLNRYFRQIDVRGLFSQDVSAAFKGSSNAMRQDFDKLWEDGDRLLDDGLDLLDDRLTWLGEKLGTRRKRSSGRRDRDS